MTKPPALGRTTTYSDQYDSELLQPIARKESRDAYAGAKLLFNGVDIWNAWELTWLGPRDLPVAATLVIIVPATTPNLVESKSFKLYLNSFAMSSFASAREVVATITTDLSDCVGDSVDVRLQELGSHHDEQFYALPGICLDTLPAGPASWDVDPQLLDVDADNIVEEDLHSHLLRSLCPVTAQPDIGSIAIHYRGPKIDRISLLQYILGYREHNDFHEACVERMFVDILRHCKPDKLSVYARYQRRGGIDINPYRSNFDVQPKNLRLWRQ